MNPCRMRRGDLRALSCCGSKLSHLSALNGCSLWSLNYTCDVDTKAVDCLGCLEQHLVQPRSRSACPALFPSPWPLSVRTPVCVTPLLGFHQLLQHLCSWAAGRKASFVLGISGKNDETEVRF